MPHGGAEFGKLLQLVEEFIDEIDKEDEFFTLLMEDKHKESVIEGSHVRKLFWALGHVVTTPASPYAGSCWRTSTPRPPPCKCRSSSAGFIPFDAH